MVVWLCGGVVVVWLCGGVVVVWSCGGVVVVWLCGRVVVWLCGGVEKKKSLFYLVTPLEHIDLVIVT